MPPSHYLILIASSIDYQRSTLRKCPPKDLTSERIRTVPPSTKKGQWQLKTSSNRIKKLKITVLTLHPLISIMQGIPNSIRLHTFLQQIYTPFLVRAFSFTFSLRTSDSCRNLAVNCFTRINSFACSIQHEDITYSGELNEHEKLMSVLREVGVVIFALAYPQVLEQFKIIEAIKAVGNIKRFLPSEFGCDEDRVSLLPPFQKFLNKKKEIRRVVEAAGIPYTFVSANLCGGYFVNYLFRPYEKRDDVIVYGTGETTALPHPENIPVVILHSLFVKGDTMNFDLGEDDIEASILYPDLQYTTIDQLLEIFLHNPPKPFSAAFA
ncbi:hypothetical protein LguiB_009771 [Lonicera macranthoides]